MNKPIAKFKGSSGVAFLYEDRVVIQGSKLIGNHGDKTIFLQHLSGVTVRKASVISGSGVIHFSTGSSEMKNAFKSVRDENALLISPFGGKKASEFKALVEKQMAIVHSKPNGVTSLSTADEIKKYKELLESDIITQEEFDAKKKQLLGL
ncbi:SHOCT domain-containing protein [Paenibacillus sp. NPDC057967]|uniref:SHOCT domain-containing protein n=1 Tax=Paenibacillus sp. NPDC057967 TaxID=3346293 RepID=UPI0036DAC64F